MGGGKMSEAWGDLSKQESMVKQILPWKKPGKFKCSFGPEPDISQTLTTARHGTCSSGDHGPRSGSSKRNCTPGGRAGGLRQASTSTRCESRDVVPFVVGYTGSLGGDVLALRRILLQPAIICSIFFKILFVFPDQASFDAYHHA